MSYNLNLYAANGAALADEFRSGEALVERVLKRVRDNGSAERDQKRIESILRSGMAGNWPDDGTTDPFTVLSCVLEAVAEPLHFPYYSEFKHFGLLDGTGLLAQFTPDDATIPLPSDPEMLSLATVLANQRMARVLEEEREQSDPEDPDCRSLRTLFLDTIESLLPDGLDLYVIVTVY